jgi:phosphoglycolate phosphatase
MQMHDDVGKFNAINIESQLYERFLLHYGHLPADKKVSCLYQGVMALLQSLANNSVAMALVTNKPAAFTPAILHGFAIDHFFRVTVCGDTLSDKKPSPLPLQYACKQLRLSVNDCLMVGDSRNDIQAAKACDMKCVSVDWGYNHSEDPAKLGANLHITAFSELLI